MSEAKDAKQLIADLLEQQANKPDLSLLTMRVIERFGGMAGFGDALVDDYFSAPEGSSQRAILARAFLELVKETQPAETDLAGEHSPDELAAAAAVAMQKAATRE